MVCLPAHCNIHTMLHTEHSQGSSYLPEATACVLQDLQGIVGSLAFAVEFDVAGETFQFYLSKRE